ncbi:MAG: hypothetical protein RL213_2156 [Bacteroidota bacterium]|jgi:hypothetical protein
MSVCLLTVVMTPQEGRGVFLDQNLFLMKTFTYVALVFGLFVAGFGRIDAATPDNRHHDGFYFSFGLGPSFGHIDAKDHYNYISDDNSYKTTYSGNPFAFDLRIGGALKRDLVVTFDMVGRSMTGPQLETDTGTFTHDDHMFFDEYTYGVGITKFFMPYNIFVGTTLGTGIFSYGHDDLSMSNDGNFRYRSKGGFSWLLRAGKSWYLGRKWGIGVAACYGGTKTSTADANGTEVLNSSNFMGLITVSYQ